MQIITILLILIIFTTMLILIIIEGSSGKVPVAGRADPPPLRLREQHSPEKLQFNIGESFNFFAAAKVQVLKLCKKNVL